MVATAWPVVSTVLGSDLLGWSIVASAMDSCCYGRRRRDGQAWFEYRGCSLGQLLLRYKD